MFHPGPTELLHHRVTSSRNEAPGNAPTVSRAFFPLKKDRAVVLVGGRRSAGCCVCCCSVRHTRRRLNAYSIVMPGLNNQQRNQPTVVCSFLHSITAVYTTESSHSTVPYIYIYSSTSTITPPPPCRLISTSSVPIKAATPTSTGRTWNSALNHPHGWTRFYKRTKRGVP